MDEGSLILFGFNTSHPKGFGQIRGYMTKTCVRFVDHTGTIANLIERMDKAEAAAKTAFDRARTTSGFVHHLWNFQERRCKENGERLLRQTRRKIQSLFRGHARRNIPPKSLRAEESGSTSAGFRQLEYSFVLDDLADDLDTASHLWLMVQRPT